jgi:hypothetical protein
MISYIRSAVALVGFGGAFCLLVAGEQGPLLLVFAILLFGAPWLLIPIVNKLFLGVYLPGPRMSPAQREAIRLAAGKDRALFPFLWFAGVGLPIIFLMKELGWGRNSVLVVGALLSVVMAVLPNVIRARQGQS